MFWCLGKVCCHHPSWLGGNQSSYYFYCLRSRQSVGRLLSWSVFWLALRYFDLITSGWPQPYQNLFFPLSHPEYPCPSSLQSKNFTCLAFSEGPWMEAIQHFVLDLFGEVVLRRQSPAPPEEDMDTVWSIGERIHPIFALLPMKESSSRVLITKNVKRSCSWGWQLFSICSCLFLQEFLWRVAHKVLPSRDRVALVLPGSGWRFPD